ncbi:hypothetical protein KC19_VG215400 [Ceratodon purpureus]|uniref:Uncharacterized protein n=1 Tax=Ceratodon purpureus TaxID=3225 RepID=A0A8T0HT00_CERPU|nr:hypothetical protein KC19_VG215400 [Ceratodon purpureus]
MIALRALGPQKTNSNGSEGPTSTTAPSLQGGTIRSSSSLPSGSTGMGDSFLPTSSGTRQASTRGSAPEDGEGLRSAPECHTAVRLSYAFLIWNNVLVLNGGT